MAVQIQKRSGWPWMAWRWGFGFGSGPHTLSHSLMRRHVRLFCSGLSLSSLESHCMPGLPQGICTRSGWSWLRIVFVRYTIEIIINKYGKVINQNRAFSLVVWFSLRVREVPSSILGMPHCFLFFCFFTSNRQYVPGLAMSLWPRKSPSIVSEQNG